MTETSSSSKFAISLKPTIKIRARAGVDGAAVEDVAEMLNAKR